MYALLASFILYGGKLFCNELVKYAAPPYSVLLCLCTFVVVYAFSVLLDGLMEFGAFDSERLTVLEAGKNLFSCAST